MLFIERGAAVDQPEADASNGNDSEREAAAHLAGEFLPWLK